MSNRNGSDGIGYQAVSWLDHHLRRAVADEGGHLLHYLAAAGADRLDVVVEFLVPPADANGVTSRLHADLRRAALPAFAADRPAVSVVPAGAFHQWWSDREDDVAPAAGLVADPALLIDLRHRSAAGWREFAADPAH